MSKNIDSYLLVDHTKFDHITLLKYADICQFKNVITDRPVPEEYVQYLARNNVALHIADTAQLK